MFLFFALDEVIFGIYEFSVLIGFKMKMRSVRAFDNHIVSDFADFRAFLHRLRNGYVDLVGQAAIFRDEPVPVRYAHAVSVQRIVDDFGHRAVPYRKYACAFFRHEVDCPMRAPLFQRF